MKDLSEYSTEFARVGYTLVRAAVRPEIAAEWAWRARVQVASRLDRETGKVANLDEGGAYHYRIANAGEAGVIIPELFGWYEAGVHILTELARRPVLCSPYTASAITVKVYDRPGDRQGWHRDTNPLTAMLILTETKGHYGTHIERRDGSSFHLENEPGDLLVMLGRELRHEVPALPEGKWRVTVPLNYYHPDDLWRPAGIDSVVYGAA